MKRNTKPAKFSSPEQLTPWSDILKNLATIGVLIYEALRGKH